MRMKIRSIALLTLAFSLVPVFFSCSTEEEVVLKRISSDNRSLEDVENIARRSYDVFFGDKTTRGSQQTVGISSVKAVRSRDTRLGASDTLLYVVNFEDDKGFALVSASTGTDALLGISDEGNYNPESGTENENFQLFVDRSLEFVTSPPTGPSTIGPFPEVCPTDSFMLKSPFLETIDESSPKIEFKWGQGYPYGMYCRNGKASCKSVAAAMIIAHYNFPYISGDCDVSIKHSDAMKHISNNECRCGEEAERIHADIARAIGKLNEYDEKNPDFSPEQFLTGKYYFMMTDPSDTVAYDDLKTDRVVFFAYDTEDWSHLWIVDGYKVLRFGGIAPKQQVYYHYNWGYDGECNGYFHPGVLAMKGGFKYDDVHHQDGNFTCSGPIQYFRIEQNIIVGID